MGDLVRCLGLTQPAVSKHLGVLRKVGIVSVTKNGPMRLYRLEPEKLRPVHDWVQKYEQFWSHQLRRIKERAERKAAGRTSSNNPSKEE